MTERHPMPEFVPPDGRFQTEIFCQTHMQIPVGDMVFHVFDVTHNVKLPGWGFKNDRHDHHELIYTINGRGYYEVEGQGVNVSKGDFFFTPRNVLHHGHIANDETRWETLVLQLDFSLARDPDVYLDDLGMFPAVLPFYRHFIVENRYELGAPPELQTAIELIVERLTAELSQRTPDYDVVLQSQMLEYLSLISRTARAELPNVPLRQYAAKARGLLQLEKARRFIQQNYTNSVSLEKVAAEACMSQYHFGRLFKKSFGMTPMQYQINLRIADAKNLLLNTETPVADIGYQLGYSSPEHFSRQFAAKVGVAPSQYARTVSRRLQGTDGPQPQSEKLSPAEEVEQENKN